MTKVNQFDTYIEAKLKNDWLTDEALINRVRVLRQGHFLGRCEWEQFRSELFRDCKVKVFQIATTDSEAKRKYAGKALDLVLTSENAVLGLYRPMIERVVNGYLERTKDIAGSDPSCTEQAYYGVVNSISVVSQAALNYFKLSLGISSN